MVRAASTGTVRHECRSAARAAGRVSRVLAEHAAFQKRLQHLARTVNLVVGLGVAFFSLLVFTPSFSAMVPQGWILAAALVAALALLADGVLPTILGEPNPDRFQDYSYYIQNYSLELTSLTEDASLEPRVWEARARELVQLTRLNVDDVFRKWPWVRRRLESKGGLEEYWSHETARENRPT